MSHPAVHETAVIAQAGEAGQSRLIAYVAGDREPSATEALRQHLKDQPINRILISTRYPMPALSRTTGGEVDRRALPIPPQQRPALERPYVAPRTPLKQFLAGLWRDVLRLDNIGVDDHFFELGGSSIQGAVLINRIQEALGVPVYVIALFDAPTIRDLARHLGASYPEAVARRFA